MSGIDWDKAPKDAQGYMTGGPFWAEGFWKKECGDKFFCQVGQTEWKKTHVDAFGQPGFVLRPSSLAWSGPQDGLPPVGVECELKSKSLGGVYGCPVKVIAYHNDFAWVDVENSEIPIVARLNMVDFLPIRTPEQKAADERLHEIRNALTTINSKVNFPNDLVRGNILAAAVEAMIDAGYRKVEQPK